MPVMDSPAAAARTLSGAYGGLELVGREPGPWRGSLTVQRLGSLRVATEELDPARIVRTPEAAALDGRAHVLARLPLDGPALLTQDGRSVRLEPGTLAFQDAGRPYRLELPQRHRARVLMVPRPVLGLDDAELRRVTAQPVGADGGGPAGLLLPLLTALVERLGPASPPLRENLARAVADLLAALAADRLAAGGPDPAAGGAGLLERIRATAERRLGEPELSPGMLAAEHGISLRYLHKLFQEQGTTVGGWVRGRRLEACRAELARPDAAGRPIAAVAARWGFVSAAHFSRAFRRAYGVSPAEWRAGAARAGGPRCADGQAGARDAA